ncbi:MAG: hypothetical protein LBJ57_06980 [Prevotellaceae bacterium]|jgi:hypothetical protein|nr:hypothetical protein [Prevotellaceae bacterium]
MQRVGQVQVGVSQFILHVVCMKKLFLLLSLGVCGMSFTLNAANALEDTSLVRISTPEARAEFLSKMMKERLGLDTEEFAAIQSINMKYEELLQELTLANPANSISFGGPKKKRNGSSPFDKLSEAREKEVKKALSNRSYREYDRQRWGMRNTLKKQMIADKENRDRVERERIAREKVKADSIAAAMESKKNAKSSHQSKQQKKPTKKSPPKKKR